MDYTVSEFSISDRGTLSGTIAMNSANTAADGTEATVRYYDGPPENLILLGEVSAVIGEDLSEVGEAEPFAIRAYPAWDGDGAVCLRFRASRSNVFSFMDVGCTGSTGVVP
jgi:hypothetical protein